MGHRDDDAAGRFFETLRQPGDGYRGSATGPVDTRAETLDDATVVRAIFVACHRGSLDGAGLDDVTIERLMQHRFDMQRAGYRFSLPDAVWEVITEADRVVGQVLTHDDGERVLVAELAVAPEHRGRGIGGDTVAGLIGRAGERPLELRLGHGSPSEAWYRSQGFELVGSDDHQIHLLRLPHATALAATGV